MRTHGKMTEFSVVFLYSTMRRRTSLKYKNKERNEEIFSWYFEEVSQIYKRIQRANTIGEVIDHFTIFYDGVMDSDSA